MNSILEKLEKTADEYPYKVAVDDGGIRLTWSELLELSKKMGTAFSKKADRGKPVAIIMEKSALTLAAMFGVVYAGCFYVMIDPTQPLARIKEIFNVLMPELVVLDRKHESILDEADCNWGQKYLLNNALWEETNRTKLESIRQHSSTSDLLYVIFTSGSTGAPKGIAVSQRAVMDFVGHFVEIFGINEADCIGNQAPFDFDVSVKDIYTSIMTGATLVLIPRELFCVPPVLLDYLCDKQVTTLIWAVSALTLVSSLKGLCYKVPSNIKRVMFSGEIMPVKQLRLWQMALPEAEFFNLYGPTEITCNCTYYPIRRIYQDGERISVGKAFPGREVFLMDEKGRKILSPGETGEIYVSGESLAEGYYRNQNETAAKFIYPFLEEPKKRCYRTGDMGYFDAEGELYFSGRKDFQVKHMGHRIELEEIEHALNQIEGLEKSCCLMDERRNQLVAFYLGESTGEKIRRELKKRVPLYMVPHKIVQISRMPLTKNGKTDRNYLKRQLEVETQ